MAVKAVLFDLVGTLVSEEEVLRRSDEVDARLLADAGVSREKIEEFNRRKLEALKIFDSLPDDEVIKLGKFYEVALNLIGVDLPREKLEKIALAYEDFWINNVKLLPGVREMLEKLSSRYKLLLVSDTPMTRVEPVLKKFNLQSFFEKVYTPEKYGRKRNLKVFEAIKNDFSISFEEMVMVGDSRKDDIEPAKKLNINTIKLGKIKPGEIYTHYARSLAEVPSLVDAIDALYAELKNDYVKFIKIDETFVPSLINLIKQIEDSRFDFDAVLAVFKKGLITATVVSMYFDKPMYIYFKDGHIHPEINAAEKILVVDDDCHTGSLIKKIREKLRGIEHKVAVQYINVSCLDKVDFYGSVFNEENAYFSYIWETPIFKLKSGKLLKARSVEEIIEVRGR